MPNFFALCVFALLDPLMTLPASLATRLIDYYAGTARRAPESEQDDPLSDCRYRLDSSDPLILTLPDSRKLSYARFGSSSPTAHTIFFCHGWPGSRIEATYLHEAARVHNIRIISIDRPGTGLSTPDPDRTILSHAKDIEHLAQHLEAERYGVLGVSGGGPYALACAKILPPDKLKVVGIVCGLGPSDIGYWGMFPLNYLGWTYAPHYLPYFTQWWFSCEPPARLDLSRQERMNMLRQSFDKARTKLPAKDAKIFGVADVMKVQVRGGEEVHLQGSRWWFHDMKLLASDPGFRVEDIRKDLEVQMWYGRLDGNVPLQHGEEIARRLRTGDGDTVSSASGGRVSLRIKDDETHASIFFDYRDEILGEMAKVL